MRIKFSVVSGFSNVPNGKNENPEKPEINRKLSKSKKQPVLTFYRRKLLQSITLLSKYNFGFNKKKVTFKLK